MKPDIKGLKAMAYDCLANIEIWQKRLREVNAEIARVSEGNDSKKESNRAGKKDSKRKR